MYCSLGALRSIVHGALPAADRKTCRYCPEEKLLLGSSDCKLHRYPKYDAALGGHTDRVLVEEVLEEEEVVLPSPPGLVPKVEFPVA